ncbi:hypothetical protein BN2476_830058 [Paraburkholderia piptadeniae]|uniref:Uncharacterized protein n=1 Tax=Paraburkholderia piptadeniae TaxID=1701573 RepID=A0A1N7SU93_9BURK|nr:hypothetical protein BN2476_830058 [Paraburkholderia piptadeniae]
MLLQSLTDLVDEFGLAEAEHREVLVLAHVMYPDAAMLVMNRAYRNGSEVTGPPPSSAPAYLVMDNRGRSFVSEALTDDAAEFGDLAHVAPFGCCWRWQLQNLPTW